MVPSPQLRVVTERSLMMTRDEIKKVAKADATIAWQRMSDSERAAVRFGMIPLHIAEKYDSYPQGVFPVALMTVAEENGGMVS